MTDTPPEPRRPPRPKTPRRSIRVPEALWIAAQDKAYANGDNVTLIVNRALREYVR